MTENCSDNCESMDNVAQNENVEAVEEVEGQQEKDLQAEIEMLKNTVLRQAADMENLRKRLEKEKNDSVKYANVGFAKDLLPVLDNFERVKTSADSFGGDEAASAKLKAFVDGVLLCEKELVSAFKRHGITKVEVAAGDMFDHQYHQAMCEIDDDKYPGGAVVNVLQSGYVHHDRLLRPAMVCVSKKK